MLLGHGLRVDRGSTFATFTQGGTAILYRKITIRWIPTVLGVLDVT